MRGRTVCKGNQNTFWFIQRNHQSEPLGDFLFSESTEMAELLRSRNHVFSVYGNGRVVTIGVKVGHIPSVPRRYMRQRGLMRSWPPMSQTVSSRPLVGVSVSTLNPMVGTVLIVSFSLNRYRIVVLPATRVN